MNQFTPSVTVLSSNPVPSPLMVMGVLPQFGPS